MNKAELRKIYNLKRNGLSEAIVEESSKSICTNLFGNFIFEKISSVHIFLPIKNKKEINTNLLIDKFKSDFPFIKIVIPKIKENQIESFLLNGETELKENSLGIPEPVSGTVFSHEDIDLVILPLLAFDKRGNRIGYGKGFYDRFLLTCKPGVIKIGLSLFEAEEEIEAEGFDIPLNFCVTPKKIYSF